MNDNIRRYLSQNINSWCFALLCALCILHLDTFLVQRAAMSFRSYGIFDAASVLPFVAVLVSAIGWCLLGGAPRKATARHVRIAALVLSLLLVASMLVVVGSRYAPFESSDLVPAFAHATALTCLCVLMCIHAVPLQGNPGIPTLIRGLIATTVAFTAAKMLHGHADVALLGLSCLMVPPLVLGAAHPSFKNERIANRAHPEEDKTFLALAASALALGALAFATQFLLAEFPSICFLAAFPLMAAICLSKESFDMKAAALLAVVVLCLLLSGVLEVVKNGLTAALLFLCLALLFTTILPPAAMAIGMGVLMLLPGIGLGMAALNLEVEPAVILGVSTLVFFSLSLMPLAEAVQGFRERGSIVVVNVNRTAGRGTKPNPKWDKLDVSHEPHCPQVEERGGDDGAGADGGVHA